MLWFFAAVLCLVFTINVELSWFSAFDWFLQKSANVVVFSLSLIVFLKRFSERNQLFRQIAI